MTQNINQRFGVRTTLAAALFAAVAMILVTTLGTRPAEAAFPGENGKIVFEGLDMNTWNYKIYGVGADGSNPTRLTENPSFEGAPAFSPDGSKIAFMSLRDEDSDVFVMGSDGSDPTNLTNNSVYDAAPNWSPDGSKITFVSERDGEDNEVFIMDAANGANPTRLTDSPTINADPDWQPLHDTAPPTVSNATPTGTSVKRNASLTATFSEEMNRATITKGTFKLFKVSPDRTTTRITNVAVSLSANGLKAKLDPYGTSTTLLPANTKYKAVITTKARDLVGNPLAKNVVWSFTTGSR